MPINGSMTLGRCDLKNKSISEIQAWIDESLSGFDSEHKKRLFMKELESAIRELVREELKKQLPIPL